MGKGISCMSGKKGKAEEVYHLVYNIKAVEKNIQWGRGEGKGNFGEENQDLENGGGSNYLVVWNFINP